MDFKITGITHKDLTDFMFDLTMGHGLKAFKITPQKPDALILTVSKRAWDKTWRDVGFKPEDSKQWREFSFKEELEGQGHAGVKVELLIIEIGTHWTNKHTGSSCVVLGKIFYNIHVQYLDSIVYDGYWHYKKFFKHWKLDEVNLCQ